jgi:glutamate dehydrogenase
VAETQLAMLIEGRRLVERATRWLARANPASLDIEAITGYFEPGARTLGAALPAVLDGGDRWAFATRVDELEQAGAPHALAVRVAGMPSMLSTFDIVDVANTCSRPVEDVMAIYFGLGSRLELNWLRDRIIELPRANRWQALARAALRDDLFSLHRALTQDVLESVEETGEAAVDHWIEMHRGSVERSTAMLSDIKASRTYDMTTLPVALREVRNLIRGGGPAQDAGED